MIVKNTSLLIGASVAALGLLAGGPGVAHAASHAASGAAASASPTVAKVGGTVVLSSVTQVPSEGPINRQARAFCPTGLHAIGGGLHVRALTSDRLGEYDTFTNISAPMGSNGEPAAAGTSAVGWEAEVTNLAHQLTGQSGRNAELTAYAICR